MTDGTDLFQPQDTPTTEDAILKLVEEIKADPEKAAKRLVDKDGFIEQLKREKGEAVEDLTAAHAELKARNSFEELVDKASKLGRTEPLVQAPPTLEEGKGSVALKPEEVTKLVNDALSEREATASATRNAGQVEKRLKEVFGPNYVTELRSRASQLGIAESTANSLARSNPRAFFKLFDVPEETVRQSDVSPRQAVRTESFTPSTKGGRKTFSDFQKLRKENPVLYQTPAVQNEMHSLYERSLEEGWDFGLDKR